MTDNPTELEPDSERPARRDAPRIPGVELGAVLGRGGMGLVYRGRQGFLERDVAVKFLDVRTPRGDFEARFHREARLLATLKHENIVACYQAGSTEDGFCFLVMELIEGPNLREWILEHGPLDQRTAVSVCRDVARALQYALRNRVIHRDVKPANVFLGHDPDREKAGEVFPYTVKLGDLGLARPSSNEVGDDEQLTEVTQGWIGTLATMAPEQFDDGGSVDHRADIYGLGCVLFQALTGDMPYSGSQTAIIRKKGQRFGPDPRQVQPDVPRELGRLVRRMLANDPDERPQTYEELIASFDDLIEEAAAPEPRRWPVLLGVTAVVLAALIWGTWGTWGARPEVDPLTPVLERSTVRAGWDVELGVAEEGLEDWDWTWKLVEPSDIELDWTAGPDSPAVRFVAPPVKAATTLTFFVRAVRTDGTVGVREASPRVTVYPRLAPEIEVVAGTLEEDGAVTFGPADPLGTSIGSDVRYAWTVIGPAGESPPEEGATISFATPQAKQDYDLTVRLAVFEDGLEAGSGERQLRVVARDDPPALLSWVGGGPSLELPVQRGDSIVLGGEVRDPEGEPVAASWRIVEERCDLEAEELDALRGALGTSPVLELVVPDRAGAVAAVALTLDDGVQRTEYEYRLVVPRIQIRRDPASEDAVLEGSTVKLVPEVPSELELSGELQYEWNLQALGDVMLVKRPGAAPAAPGAEPSEPDLVAAQRANRLDFEAPRGWKERELEFKALGASGPYQIHLTLEIRDEAGRARETSRASVQVQATDAPAALVLVAPSTPVLPGSKLELEARLFDPDSEVDDGLLDEVEWTIVGEATRVGSPKPSRLIVRAPSEGSFQIAARISTSGGELSSDPLSIDVAGSLELEVAGTDAAGRVENGYREGDDVELVARVALLEPSGRSSVDSSAEWVFEWELLESTHSLWDSGASAAGSPMPWSDRAALADREIQRGAELRFEAPQAASDYELEFIVYARRRGEAEVAFERKITVPVTAVESATEFDFAGWPTEVRVDRPPKIEAACVVRDTDSALANYRWAVLAEDGSRVPIGVDTRMPADGRVPWPAEFLVGRAPGSYTLVLLVHRAGRDAGVAVSDPQVVRVLPKPAIGSLTVPTAAAEGDELTIRTAPTGLDASSLVLKPAELVRQGGLGAIHVVDRGGQLHQVTPLTSSVDLASWLALERSAADASTWTFRALEADAPYSIRFEMTADLGSEGSLSESATVRVDADDDPGRLRLALPSTLVCGPDASVALRATVEDPDSPVRGRPVRWSVAGVEGARVSNETSLSDARLDLSRVRGAAEGIVRVEGEGLSRAELTVRVEPRLQGFPAGAVELMPDVEPSSDFVEGWTFDLCVEPGWDFSQCVGFARYTQGDSWNYLNYGGRPPEAYGSLEHPLPSAGDFRLTLDLTPGTVQQIHTLGVLVEEAVPPGEQARALGLRIRGDHENLIEELVTGLRLDPPERYEHLDIAMRAQRYRDLETREVGRFRFDDYFSGVSGEGLGAVHYATLELRREGEALFLRWGGEEHRLDLDFAPGTVGVWTGCGRVFLRDVRLEPR